MYVSWKLNRTIIVTFSRISKEKSPLLLVSIFQTGIIFIGNYANYLFCHCDVKAYSITLDLWPWCHVGYQKSDQSLDMIERVLTPVARYCNKKYTLSSRKVSAILRGSAKNWCEKFVSVVLPVLKSLLETTKTVNFYKCESPESAFYCWNSNNSKL